MAENLDQFTLEHLKKKETGIKTMIWIFIVLIVALSFFYVKEYLESRETDFASLTIIICTIGGLFTQFPALKEVREAIAMKEE